MFLIKCNYFTWKCNYIYFRSTLLIENSYLLLFTLPSHFYCLRLRLQLAFFFIHFNIRYFVVLRKTGTIAHTIAIERGVSHKKEVCVAFGVISDTARREIGFNAFFFHIPARKKNRDLPTFEISTSRGFSRQLFPVPSKFYCIDHQRGYKISPRFHFFLFHLFLF